jgi:acyl CoA:acetate/3-ketoacid CoA transferase alpha subunit
MEDKKEVQDVMVLTEDRGLAGRQAGRMGGESKTVQLKAWQARENQAIESYTFCNGHPCLEGKTVCSKDNQAALQEDSRAAGGWLKMPYICTAAIPLLQQQEAASSRQIFVNKAE